MSEIKRDILFRIIPSYLNTVEKYSIQEILPRKIEDLIGISNICFRSMALTVETTLHTLTMYNIIVFKIYTLQNN